MKGIIRFFTAGALLMLFAVSIMPKVYLHDIFASHQDIIGQMDNHAPGIVKDGYSCDINDQVATSPFTATDKVIIVGHQIDFAVFHTRYTSQIATAAPACFTLRGPPVLA